MVVYSAPKADPVTRSKLPSLGLVLREMDGRMEQPRHPIAAIDIHQQVPGRHSTDTSAFPISRLSTFVSSLIVMRYKLRYSPSPKRFSFAINLGIASVKGEVNILVSYLITTSNKLELSLSEKRVTHGELIHSKIRVDLRLVRNTPTACSVVWERKERSGMEAFMCFTLVAPREMLDGTVESRR